MNSSDSRWPRRAWLGGAGLAGLGAAATFAYRAAPAFWKQFVADSRRPIQAPATVPHPSRWPDRGLFAAWLGHATVLLKIDGFTILTDPVFSERAGIGLGLVTLGVKRLVAPALAVSQLPPIDLVLLSHAHFDHTDLPSLRALENRGTAVIHAVRNGDLVRAEGWRSTAELGWGQGVRTGPAAVSAYEVNHWGARMRSDTYRGYNAYLIEVGRYRVLFAGDTAATDLLRKVRSSAELHLAIMPIGAYDPWIHYHCTPEQAWRMANEAGAEYVLPVHHQTFALGREPRLEPIERLDRVAGPASSRIALQSVGEEFRLS
jgi:L-ascorbate metabolism protein UlaG (beta-lactamase superfamily)